MSSGFEFQSEQHYHRQVYIIEHGIRHMRCIDMSLNYIFMITQMLCTVENMIRELETLIQPSLFMFDYEFEFSCGVPIDRIKIMRDDIIEKIKQLHDMIYRPNDDIGRAESDFISMYEHVSLDDTLNMEYSIKDFTSYDFFRHYTSGRHIKNLFDEYNNEKERNIRKFLSLTRSFIMICKIANIDVDFGKDYDRLNLLKNNTSGFGDPWGPPTPKIY